MENGIPNKSISILGCGWLGWPLATALLAKGFVVKGSTTSPEKLGKLQQEGISPFLIQLSKHGDYSQLPAFLDSHLLVINYPPGVRKGGSGEFEQSFELLLTHLQRSKVDRIIYVSSTSVYPNTNNTVEEEMELTPASPSGKVLLEAETKLSALTDKEVTILRMAGLIGYDRQPARFFAGKAGLTNGDELVNLIHRDDCLEIIQTIIAHPNTGTFNCCSDTHPSKKEFYTRAATHLGLAQPVFVATDEVAYKVVSNAKLKEKLGYQFKFGDLTQFNWP